MDALQPAPARRFLPWLADIAWLGLLSVYVFWGRASVPLHGDETTYIAMSHDWVHFVLDPDLSRLFFTEDPVDPERQAERVGVGPLPVYGIGIAWALAGYSPGDIPTVEWDWIAPIEANVQEGRAPDPALLTTARAFSAATLALGIAGMFWLGMLIRGRPLAYLASGLMALNPLLLLHARRAMAEGPLIGFGLLAMAACAAYVVFYPHFTRPAARIAGLITIGTLVGLSFTAKHNGALNGMIVAIVLATHAFLAPSHAQALVVFWQRLGQAAWQVTTVAVVALAVSFALMPAFWSDPDGAFREMVRFRFQTTRDHTENWGAYESPSERLNALWEEALSPRAAYFDIAAWAPFLNDPIRAYHGTWRAGLPQIAFLDWLWALLGCLGIGVVVGWLLHPADERLRVLALLVLVWLAATAIATYFLILIQWQRYYLPLVPPLILVQAIGTAWGLEQILLAVRGQITWPAVRWPLTAAGAAVFLLALGWAVAIEPYQTNERRMLFSETPAYAYPVQARLAGQVALLGYDIRQDNGRQIEVTLFWRNDGGPLSDELSTILTLHDTNGWEIAQAETPFDTAFTTSSWPSGTLVREELWLMVPPGTPPGRYDLRVALYSLVNDLTATVESPAASPDRLSLALGSIVLGRIGQPADPLSLVATPLVARLNDDITVVGTGAFPGEVTAGDEIVVDIAWQAKRAVHEAYAARFIWRSSDGAAVHETGEMPPLPDYPTDKWRAGDTWESFIVLDTPPVREDGAYELGVRLINEADEVVGEVILARVGIDAPERSYELPPARVPLELAWQNGIVLRGYNLQADGENLTIDLYWQPAATPSERLYVFLHLLDAQDVIVAQSDHIPAGGARPTTGWLPGEVILDPVTLPFPANDSLSRYRLRIGWYDPATGTRMPVQTGDEFVTLPLS